MKGATQAIVTDIKMIEEDSPRAENTRGSLPTSRKVGLDILTWNINDNRLSVEGAKSDLPEFKELIESYPIFALQETKGKVSLPNYICYNTLRAGSRSGGLCVGIHKSLEVETKPLVTNCEDIQAVSVSLTPKQKATGSKEVKWEFTIINVYDSPECSSFKRKKRVNNNGNDGETTIDQLLDFMASNDLGSIYLCGDFNARTRDMNHIIMDEDGETSQFQEGLNNDMVSTRSSRDTVLNARGKKFLDLLACTNLTLLNGNTLGDVFGEYTSINYNGASVVDYSAVSADLENLVTKFVVGDLNRFSDHCPCIGSLSIPIGEVIDGESLLESLEDAPAPYKWGPGDPIEIDASYLAAQRREEFDQRLDQLSTKTCVHQDDVIRLNKELVGVLKDIADSTIPRKLKRQPAKTNKITSRKLKMKPKHPWFDTECIVSKRKLNILSKTYGKHPSCSTKRENYYGHRKEYKKLTKSKKWKFYEDLTRDIESGNNINWKRLKKLKQSKGSSKSLDAFDMKNFCDFFAELYSRTPLPEEKVEWFKSMTRRQDGIVADPHDTLSDILDGDISDVELLAAISNLKRGKAVSEDLVSNEFLKATGTKARQCIKHLFNECLRTGAYPWTTSIVTPLHKKGSLYDPNNYRAIAVASNMGKLFAGILLQRLIKFRSLKAPDTPNQLGFQKNAQTCDHILTLTTCVKKYTSRPGEKLFTCFVDYAKAFDSVCREALLYKLWDMGINGRYFRCLERMYTSSSAKIKLISKLSEKIMTSTGTEQGHPMSPELFKCYIHLLSEQLNTNEIENVPVLNGVRISHLFWADDLILMAQSPASLQLLLNILHSYCLEWGLTVNISKTAVMVFNKTGRLLKASEGFSFGELQIPTVREYCYLGITFSLSGSLKLTQEKLRQKALRSYFSLKRLVEVNALRPSTLLKLFDTLILPVASYGCQTWIHETNYIKKLSDSKHFKDSLIKCGAKDAIERLHLTFMKWCMGVGKRTSNASVYGDTGRSPLVVKVSKQAYAYFDRLRKMDISGEDTLARHAFAEQKALGMSWYSTLKSVRDSLSGKTRFEELYPSQIRKELEINFKIEWDTERQLNKKLAFYNGIKDEMKEERYLKEHLSRDALKRLAQFRMSGHKYAIETGRYNKTRSEIDRVCPSCCTDDTEILILLSELPMFEPIVENEEHILYECPKYDHLRHSQTLSGEVSKMLEERETKTLFQSVTLVRPLAKLLLRCHNIRHPKED